MPMPETTVYQNYRAVLCENDIWLRRQVFPVKPEAISVSVKQRPYQQFRGSIATADPGHHQAALRLAYDISHPYMSGVRP